MHPNCYSQIALGTCLGLHLGQRPANHACVNQTGAGLRGMRLQPAPAA